VSGLPSQARAVIGRSGQTSIRPFRGGAVSSAPRYSSPWATETCRQRPWRRREGRAPVSATRGSLIRARSRRGSSGSMLEDNLSSDHGPHRRSENRARPHRPHLVRTLADVGRGPAPPPGPPLRCRQLGPLVAKLSAGQKACLPAASPAPTRGTSTGVCHAGELDSGSVTVRLLRVDGGGQPIVGPRSASAKQEMRVRPHRPRQA
jgi:hypothetical protein